MCPHDMNKYRQAFDQAAAQLGWTTKKSVRYHERDENCSWTEDVWLAHNGDYLFDESDLSEGLVKEIIRLAGLRGENGKS